MANSFDATIPQIHPTGWKILKNFQTNENLRFNQIKNFDIDPRNFVYHLSKLIESRLVSYIEEQSCYALTQKGKLLLEHFNETISLESIPISVFIGLFVKKAGKILAVERMKVPYLGHVGIPTFGVNRNEFLSESAKKSLKSLGLSGELFHALIIETIYKDPNGDSITHSNMHVFCCSKPIGEVVLNNDEGKLLWLTESDFLAQKKGYEDSKTLIDFFNRNNNFDRISIISKVDTKTTF